MRENGIRPRLAQASRVRSRRGACEFHDLVPARRIFNARYFLDVLGAIQDDEIELAVSGELDPAVVRPANEGMSSYSTLRCLPNPNSPVAKPADPEQPGFCRHDARRADATKAHWQRRGETVKPFCGRKRIELPARRSGPARVEMRFRAVLESILQHIHERIPHLPWPGKRSPMPTIRPKPAAPKQHAVHAPRHSHHEPTHAGTERRGVRRFDDQMHVIILHRVMHDSEVR